jgi:hypothetical protein
VVQSKHALVEWVRNVSRQSESYRYRPSSLYETLVKRLFRDHLHKDDSYRICFAKRGGSDRTAALGAALADARRNFARRWAIRGEGAIELTVSTPPQSPGLQAVDYFLWAVQRCYERREDRYVKYLWPKAHRVHDIDDRRAGPTGVYYTQRRPLTVEKLPRQREGKGWEI